MCSTELLPRIDRTNSPGLVQFSRIKKQPNVVDCSMKTATSRLMPPINHGEYVQSASAVGSFAVLYATGKVLSCRRSNDSLANLSSHPKCLAVSSCLLFEHLITCFLHSWQDREGACSPTWGYGLKLDHRAGPSECHDARRHAIQIVQDLRLAQIRAAQRTQHGRSHRRTLESQRIPRFVKGSICI